MKVTEDFVKTCRFC